MDYASMLAYYLLLLGVVHMLQAVGRKMHYKDTVAAHVCRSLTLSGKSQPEVIRNTTSCPAMQLIVMFKTPASQC